MRTDGYGCRMKQQDILARHQTGGRAFRRDSFLAYDPRERQKAHDGT
jgi:hypothetical protein